LVFAKYPKIALLQKFFQIKKKFEIGGQLQSFSLLATSCHGVENQTHRKSMHVYELALAALLAFFPAESAVES
jgi:hypothetical protein